MTLYPRKPSAEALQAEDHEAIDRAKAHLILDRYAAGGLETQTRINWALRMTGDLTLAITEVEDYTS